MSYQTLGAKWAENLLATRCDVTIQHLEHGYALSFSLSLSLSLSLALSLARSLSRSLSLSLSACLSPQTDEQAKPGSSKPYALYPTP